MDWKAEQKSEEPNKTWVLTQNSPKCPRAAATTESEQVCAFLGMCSGIQLPNPACSGAPACAKLGPDHKLRFASGIVFSLTDIDSFNYRYLELY